MPVELGVWRIDHDLKRVDIASLDQEKRLEDFLDADISIASLILEVISLPKGNVPEGELMLRATARRRDTRGELTRARRALGPSASLPRLRISSILLQRVAE